MVEALHEQSCQPVESGSTALSQEAIDALLERVDNWTHDSAANEIRKAFSFSDYHHTMAFVNAVAWIAHKEDHHPDLAVGYNRCTVRFSTHSIGGISTNDFICAAKIDKLGA